MIDLNAPNYCPSPEEIGEYIRNSVFDSFYTELCQKYNTTGHMEFSKCSWIPGWNIKFKKSGKSLCTIYPKENYFTVLVVVGKKEKDSVEELLPELSPEIRTIYQQTEEGNGQRWLMIDLEDQDTLYQDVLQLIDIRRKSK